MCRAHKLLIGHRHPDGVLSSFEGGRTGQRKEDSLVGTSKLFKSTEFYCAIFLWSRLIVVGATKLVSITLNKAKQNMAEANVPMATLALICGLRPTTLSSAYREVMTLPSTTEARLLTVACRLLDLHEVLSPLRLPDGHEDLGRLIAQLEDGHVSLEEIRAAVQRVFGQ